MTEAIDDLKDIATAAFKEGISKVENKIQTPKDPAQVLKWARYHTITNIILIIVIIGIGIYVWNNIESLRLLGGDVCRLCESKTGAVCSLPYKLNP